MSANSPRRVFLGLMEICGYYGALNSGLRDIGVESHFLDLGDDHYKYLSDEPKHVLIAWVLYSHRRFNNTRSLGTSNPIRYLYTGSYVLSLIILLCWLCIFFDVIVYKSGISLFANGVDLKLLRFFKKTIVFFYHGSDSRPPYLNGGYKNYSAKWIADRTAAMKKHVQVREEYANFIVDNPLASHLHTHKVVPSQLIGNPVDLKKIQKAMAIKFHADENGSTRILHAPSSMEIKGTDLVREAIKSLKTKGHSIEYHELTGVPNSVVMEEIRKSDFIVDELFSDTHGAMLSLEAAALGKPSVVGGYGFSELNEYIPPYARVPTVICRAEEIESTIEKLLLDREFLRQSGEKAKDFAERFAKPCSVAKRFLTLVSGEAPASWFFNPSQISYFGGLGATEFEIKKMINSLLKEEGLHAFCLKDKPEVLAKLISYAASNKTTKN